MIVNPRKENLIWLNNQCSKLLKDGVNMKLEEIGKKIKFHITRGFYVLFKKDPSSKTFQVKYIGAAGISKETKRGIGGRFKEHEVNDNISREEILELESLLPAIFRYDDRIKLENKQKGSKILSLLRKDEMWNLSEK